MATSRTLSMQGFTLVELIIAMAVFSFLLLIAAGGFINVVHIDRTNRSARNTQQNARSAMEEMMRAVRVAGDAKIFSGGGNSLLNRLCLIQGGSTMQIFYVQHNAATNTNDLHEGEISASSGACSAGVLNRDHAITSATDVSVVDFQPVVINPSGTGTTKSVQVELRLSSSDITLTTNTAGNQNTTTCDPAKSGFEFCSVTVLQSAASLEGK